MVTGPGATGRSGGAGDGRSVTVGGPAHADAGPDAGGRPAAGPRARSRGPAHRILTVTVLPTTCHSFV